MPNNLNWDSDELTLKNELKLIDDSYYRVYDDNDYEIWKERMLSIIESHLKIISNSSDSKLHKNLNVIDQELESEAQDNVEMLLEPTINDEYINPVKPMILDLPAKVIYKGIDPAPPNIENYNLNVSWGMKYLLSEIDQNCQDSTLKIKCKSMILDCKPGRTKWNNPNRVGQDELYQGLEKVLIDLKAYTPYSIPFLVKVSKKDVPDYYNVIKRPMDLGTIGKKLKNQEYNNKQQFIDDLNLIFSNCFTYNTAEDSIYRQHIQMLRDKWTYLLKSVPEIVVGKPVGPLSKETKFENPNSNFTSQTKLKIKSKKSEDSLKLENYKTSSEKESCDFDEDFDDLDDLLKTHLESLSDTESCPSPKKTKKTLEQSFTPTSTVTTNYKQTETLPCRSEKLMVKYGSDCKAAWMKLKPESESEKNKNHQTERHGHGQEHGHRHEHEQEQEKENEQEDRGSFVFPELVYFFNTVPDTHIIYNRQQNNKKTDDNDEYDDSKQQKPSYCSKGPMNRLYDNFRILQSIRDLRKHLLEASRAQLPSLDHLKIPSTKFDDFEWGRVETSWQAKAILKKIIGLYLGQAGFEMISGAALHAIFEMVQCNLNKLFNSLKLLFEEFGKENNSAEILRLALLQLNIRHLSDLEIVMTEESFAKERLEHLLEAMKLRVQEFQTLIKINNFKREERQKKEKSMASKSEEVIEATDTDEDEDSNSNSETETDDQNSDLDENENEPEVEEEVDDTERDEIEDDV